MARGEILRTRAYSVLSCISLFLHTGNKQDPNSPIHPIQNCLELCCAMTPLRAGLPRRRCFCICSFHYFSQQTQEDSLIYFMVNKTYFIVNKIKVLRGFATFIGNIAHIIQSQDSSDYLNILSLMGIWKVSHLELLQEVLLLSFLFLCKQEAFLFGIYQK